MGQWSTGKYRSRKDGKIYDYKSSWEAIYMDGLDSHPEVASWSYEPFFVIYLDGTRTKKYLPDFFVETTTGLKVIVEIKPERLRASEKNSSKREMVLQKCKEESWEYYEWAPGQEIIPSHKN